MKDQGFPKYYHFWEKANLLFHFKQCAGKTTLYLFLFFFANQQLFIYTHIYIDII